jgi:hypothetical protein
MVSTSLCVIHIDVLLIVILFCSASSKHVALDTVFVPSMLESQLAKRCNHVLDDGVLSAAVLAALFKVSNRSGRSRKVVLHTSSSNQVILFSKKYTIAITIVTPILYAQTTTTVTISVHPSPLCTKLLGGLVLYGAPDSQPKTQKRVARTSTPKMAKTSWKEGHVLPPRVTKMSQFSVSETSRNRISCTEP